MLKSTNTDYAKKIIKKNNLVGRVVWKSLMMQ